MGKGESLGSINRKKSAQAFKSNMNVNRGVINILKGKGTLEEKGKKIHKFEGATSGAKKDPGFSQHMNVRGAIKAHGGMPKVQGGGI